MNGPGAAQTRVLDEHQFDFVDARGFHCMIDTIQPIDDLRMQRDLRKK